MSLREWLEAFLLGVIQGIFEWLPVSSEGNVAIAMTALAGDPALAVQFALFLHLGTALAATTYYRADIYDLIRALRNWRPGTADQVHRELTFLVLATLVAAAVALAAYVLLLEAVTAIAGGAFIGLVGILLVFMGFFEWISARAGTIAHRPPGLLDAVLVGIGQGLAVLPGVSRSGTTVGILLLRAYDGPIAFRLSFLLAIPASIGGGILALVARGGIPGVAAGPALLALATSAIVGYGTIDLLMRIVDRVRFWAVCIGLGVLAMIGGGVLLVG